MARCRAHAAHWPPCCGQEPRACGACTMKAARYRSPARRTGWQSLRRRAVRVRLRPACRHRPRSRAPGQARSGQPGRCELRSQRLALAHADEREVQAGAVADGRAAAHGLQDIAAFGLAPRARLRRAGRRVTRAPVAVRMAPPLAKRGVSSASVTPFTQVASRGVLSESLVGDVQQKQTQSRSVMPRLAHQAERRSTRSTIVGSTTERLAVVRACTTTPQYSTSCPLVPYCSLRCTSRSARCIAALCNRQTPGSAGCISRGFQRRQHGSMCVSPGNKTTEAAYRAAPPQPHR